MNKIKEILIGHPERWYRHSNGDIFLRLSLGTDSIVVTHPLFFKQLSVYGDDDVVNTKDKMKIRLRKLPDKSAITNYCEVLHAPHFFCSICLQRNASLKVISVKHCHHSFHLDCFVTKIPKQGDVECPICKVRCIVAPRNVYELSIL